MAVNTPTSVASVASSSAKYPEWVRPSGSFSSQENSSSPGTRKAVMASSTRATPSMPSANRVPKAGIQSTPNSSWKRTPASASGTE